MDLKKMIGKSEDSPQGAKNNRGVASGLGVLLANGMELSKDREIMLKEGMDKGLAFFEKFNESRLQLAFSSFDGEMKKALFEVLFLLHVNDPKWAQWSFTAVKAETVQGVRREKEVAATADLYVEGAPYGVEGIERLSPVFRKEFEAYVQQVFNTPVSPQSGYGYNAVVSIHSLGSIGTIGHKSKDSDLDLQVQFELEPLLFDPTQWNDQIFRETLSREVSWRVTRLRVQEGLPPEALKDAATKQALMNRASLDTSRSYPVLWKYLITRERDYSQDLAAENGATIRTHIINEITTLMKRASRLAHGESQKKKEALFRERIQRIQQYLFDKFPQTEIYLFTCSNDDYRRGFHGTTLESKEASGSAYELILNYETLMPGIQITPMVPSHFVLPKSINDDSGRYEKLMDYIRFDLIRLYHPVRDRLVNLGPTPDMTLEYVGNHGGAIYWEAFKASSGNLPKAILNLFRIEMLLDKRFLKTIIQIIKDPLEFNRYVTPKPEDAAKEIEEMVEGKTGLPTWALPEMETLFPLLLQDPWWLRYKALKIGFVEPQGVPGLDPEERRRISAIIDMAFALHVRISDVFTKPGDTRPFASFREKVLLEFLRRAFPPVSQRRTFLEHMFIGEVRSVNHFESELRDLFKRSLKRVNDKILTLHLKGEGNKKEFEIWYHYYQENFEPAPNVVQRTIMNHLKVPRGRLQVGYKIGEGWFFRSLQKQSGVGKRFDTFGTLDHLPDEVDLLENVGFLEGLTHCIINGYYGILNKGTLKESRTQLEFHPKFMDMGNRTDNTYAFIRPDNVERILNLVLGFFPYQPYHYMDCIRMKRRIDEVLVFVNLLKFGRISLLYRDNLRTWYCDNFDHPDVFNAAQKLHGDKRQLMMAKPIHISLAGFFKSKGIKLDDIKLGAWVNPNSLETGQGLSQAVQKETALSEEFHQIIMHVHGPKPAPEPHGEQPE